MKEHPIPMADSMAQACYAGRKTQTRRVVKSPAKNLREMGMERKA